MKRRDQPPGMVPDCLYSLTAYLVSVLAGFLFLKKFLAKSSPDALLLIGLAPGAGLAFSAVLLFTALSLFNSLPRLPLIAAHILVIACFLRGKSTDSREKTGCSKKQILLWGLFLFLAVLLFLAKALKSPYGSGMDVWEIWKLKTEFLYRDPSHWQNIFSRSLARSHPDYPLYYPLAIVWGWILAGRENLQAPLGVSLLFTLGTLGVLAGALREKGLRFAAAAFLFLLSTPHFMGMGGSQYADILAAYFCLSALALFHLSLSKDDPRLACLSGFFAGTAAFVKNEGLLFCLVIAAAFMIVSFRRRLIWFLLGALPFLSCTAYLKYLAHYPNELFSLEFWGKIIFSGTLPDRAFVIIRSVLREFTNENSWAWGWYFLGALFLLRIKSFARAETLRPAAVILAINLGYFFIYLVTPMELQMHLETSLNRLLLHTYPALIYLGFLVYTSGEN